MTLQNDFKEKVIYSIFFSGNLFFLYSLIVLQMLPNSSLFGVLKFLVMYVVYFLMFLYGLEYFFGKRLNSLKVTLGSLSVIVILFLNGFKFPINISGYHLSSASKIDVQFKELSLYRNSEVLWNDGQSIIIEDYGYLVYFHDNKNITTFKKRAM